MNANLHVICAATVVVLWCPPDQTMARVGSSDAPIALVGATILPMDRDVVLRDHVVVVRDGVIESVAPAAAIALPDGAVVIDATGGYLMPGLVDAHVHLLDVHDLDLHLEHGITSVLNMSGSPLQLAWRDEIARSARRGPTLYTTGPMFKLEAHPAIDMELSVPDARTATMLVEMTAAQGYDFAKVWGAFSPEVYAAIADTAARLDVRLIGHIPRDVGLAGVLAAGQDGIAHVEEYFNKYFMGRIDAERLPEAVQLTADAGIPVITTVVTYEAIAASTAEDMAPLLGRPARSLLDPVRQLSWEPEFNRFRANRVGRDGFYRDALAFKLQIAAALHQGGVPLIAGSDSGELPGLVPGADLHRELKLLVDAGLTPYEALRTATRNAGAFLEPDGPFGTIAPGRRADLVLLDANPLEDIANLAAVRGVMTRGIYYNDDDFKVMAAERERRNAATGEYVRLVLEQGIAAATAHYEQPRQSSPKEPAFAEMPLCFLAYNLAERGDMASAVGALQLVIREYPDVYRAYYMLGGAALAAGDHAAARAMLQRVLELSPGHPTAKLLLDQLPPAS